MLFAETSFEDVASPEIGIPSPTPAAARILPEKVQRRLGLDKSVAEPDIAASGTIAARIVEVFGGVRHGKSYLVVRAIWVMTPQERLHQKQRVREVFCVPRALLL